MAALFLPMPAQADTGGQGTTGTGGDNAIPIWKSGETVVSFTFDGGYKDQNLAAEILAKHGLAGTFYINSGYIGYPAYLTTDDLRDIARNRSEIGGGSLFNDDLEKLDASRAHQEVCDDRATLSQLGFQVTSFSYPYGNDSPSAKAAVEGCGYNNARSVAGLYAAPEECASCPNAETLPATDDFRIRTLGESRNLAYIENHVRLAEEAGGGWMPLIFTHVCVCTKLGDAGISPEQFEALVKWVTTQPKVRVLTVDQVMGGDLKPIVGQPQSRIMPQGLTLPPKDTPPPSGRSAATLWGFHINQGTLVGLGLAVGLTVVITYRVATRGNRYDRVHG